MSTSLESDHQRVYRLSLLFLVLSFLHFASSSTLIIFSQIWQSSSSLLHEEQMMRFIILKGFFNAALALGIYGVLTVMLGLCGILEPRQIGNLSRVRGLNLFSAMLFVNLILTITIGTLVWFWTLRERSEYAKMWDASETKMKEYLQDHFECCGYWESTTILANSTNLTNDSQGFCETLMNNATTSKEDVQGCVGPISLFADNLLSNIFTFIYALTIIQFSLILTTRCLVIARKEQERFRVLDEKKKQRGGSRFHF